jgi:uncharacterized protein (TIGR02145 family)
MKKMFLVSGFIISVLSGILMFNAGCNNEENNPITLTLPILATDAVSDITASTATCGGNIASDGGDTISARGVCWSTLQTPTLSDSITKDSIGTGRFTSHLTKLIPNTPYYVRAYATNSVGTAYGETKTFNTLQLTEVDIDGHVYKTVTIGKQTWFAQNLRVTRYRNGNPITKVTAAGEWSTSAEGAFTWYENDSAAYETLHGKLYNWYAVGDPRALCPTGWHVPTDADWSELTDHLGGESIAGGKLKDTTTTLWQSPNEGANNETGFTALPGGERMDDGSFQRINQFGYLWSSSLIPSLNVAFYRDMAYNNGSVKKDYYKREFGLSVRCIRD